MAILSLQRRLAEVGRIRLGQQIETKAGKKRPAALTTFRLTSSDKSRIEEAAKLYGGQVTKWDAPSGLDAWEVITKAEKLPVVVPPSAMAFSQHYELWAAGGCKRRCDGVTETLSEQPCLCDPDVRECDIHTRLSVMLRDLSGLGVWRVDTQGYYAAVELQGSVEVISLAAGRGQMLPATLRLDQRVIKRDGDGTKRFVVPVLDVEVSPAQLLMGTVAIGGGAMAAIPAAEETPQRALTPVPEGGPAPSIADQVTASENQPSRRRASTQEIPKTGLAPRTAAQAQQAQAARRNPVSRVTDTFPPPDPADAQEAAEVRRMCTTPQLTKLGILLNNMGFEDRATRLEFCAAAIRELMPDSPSSARTITTSKELTFDEAHALINMLEVDEKKRRQQEQEETPAPDLESPPEPESPEEPQPAEPQTVDSVEAAAEKLRQSRAETPAVAAAAISDLTESAISEDPESDSPHGPGCEPGCALTEDEHPPVEPAPGSSSANAGDPEPEPESTSTRDKSESEPDDAQMNLI